MLSERHVVRADEGDRGAEGQPEALARTGNRSSEGHSESVSYRPDPSLDRRMALPYKRNGMPDLIGPLRAPLLEDGRRPGFYKYDWSLNQL